MHGATRRLANLTETKMPVFYVYHYVLSRVGVSQQYNSKARE